MPKKSSDKKTGVQPQDELTDLLGNNSRKPDALKITAPDGPIAKDETKTRFEEIPLRDIKLSPTNPRTTYDEKDTQELAESIKVEGVIQPVLLRPYGKPGKYQLIFGNRRFKASQLAGKETIPALIRELSDEEALNMQIIENLQRKDVKPIEEAVSYKMLMDMKGYTVAELSHRLGKPPKFISQRLKLNDLIDEFQKALYEERISITDALKVCKLNATDQKELYASVEDDETIVIKDHMLNQFMYDLTDAPFDTLDATIVPSMGPCEGCQYNTACAALFPEPNEKARCTNNACFKSKAQVWYDRELGKAQEDPTTVLISFDQSANKTMELMRAGIKVYAHNEFDEIYPPDDFDEIAPDGDSDEADIEYYNDQLEDYNKELAQYNKEIETAIKAFVVDGHGRGTYTYIQFSNGKLDVKGRKTAGGKEPSESEQKAAQIKEEIERLEKKEVRQKELDWFKVLPDAYKWFEEAKTHANNSNSLTLIEQAALIVSLVGYDGHDFARWAKIPDSARGNISLYNWLKTKSPEQLDKWITMLLRKRLMGYIRPLAEQHPLGHANVVALLDQATAYFPERTADLMAGLEAKTDKRGKKLTPHLIELRDQLKELEGSKLDKIIKGSKKK